MMSPAETRTSLLEHFARYFDACDRRDIDTIMRMMEGAAVEAGGNETHDAADIRAMYEARQPAPLEDGRRVTKHHVTNLIVDGPDQEGVYAVSAYYFRLQANHAGPYVAASGRLRQAVKPDGAQWRVLRHAIISDF